MVAVLLAVAGWYLVLRSNDGLFIPPDGGGPVSGTFTVPTYDWDGRSAMDALVSGTLWFTPEGCTIMTLPNNDPVSASAVYFPNATGVTYDNGTRAVVDADGKVFAVEGQEFEYGGGYIVSAEDALGQEWAAQCPGPKVRGGALVNDDPAGSRLSKAPAPPNVNGPTALPSDDELGYFPVPTYTRGEDDPAADQQIEGDVTFSDERCPIMRDAEGGAQGVTGLIFPDAEGHRAPEDPEFVRIEGSFNDGMGVMAMAGERGLYAGHFVDAHDARWVDPCENVPVDQVFQVFDHQP